LDKLHVLTLVGTRPEVIRLSRIIPKLDQFFRHTLIHTGQNYDHELNQIFFSELGLRNPDHYLGVSGKTAAETIANVISKSDEIFAQVKPDALLILGDTNSSLAAISAKRRKIPIFHMEAGNRCYDLRVPEEINRKIVDHIADINLTYSDLAREYLLREGLPPDQIIKTGSPMREVIEANIISINKSQILKKLSLKAEDYFLVSAHREETVDNPKNLQRLIASLNKLSQTYEMPVIFSTHPRTQMRLIQENLLVHGHIRFLKPFGFFDYMNLQLQAKCVLSDSGTITEEASICNFPALNLREVQERPEGFEEAAVMMVGLDIDRILNGLEILKEQKRGSLRTLLMVKDYQSTNLSEKIPRIILSYVSYVNQFTWKKAEIEG